MVLSIVKGGEDMNVAQLAKEYNVQRQTVYTWVTKGMPHKKVTLGMRQVYKFDLEEVKEWMEQTRKV